LVKRRQERKTTIKAKRDEWRAKAEKYDLAYRQQQRTLINERRVARNTGNFFVEPETKVAFVIRLKGYIYT
jgi:large subunit ribosomal protein L7e